MWAKAIPQVIELLPHARRLLPLLDEYLEQKKAAKASGKPLPTVLEGNADDSLTTRLIASHTALQRAVEEQTGALVKLAEDVALLHNAVAQMEARAERQAVLLRGALGAGVVASLLSLATLATVLLHHAH